MNSLQGWASAAEAFDGAMTASTAFLSIALDNEDFSWTRQHPVSEFVPVTLHHHEGHRVTFVVQQASARAGRPSGRWVVVEHSTELGANVAIHLPGGLSVDLV